MGDVVDNESQQLSEFEDAKRWLCIPLNYGFIWEKLQYIPLLHGSLPLEPNVAPWVNWRLPNGTRLLQVTTNILYHHTKASLSWLSPKAEKVWNVCKLKAKWCQILQRGWHSYYSCKGIHMDSHDWWAPIRFNLKEMRTRVRYILLLDHSIGGQYRSVCWNFWMLSHMELISLSAYSGFLMSLLDVHLPT